MAAQPLICQLGIGDDALGQIALGQDNLVDAGAGALTKAATARSR